MPTDPAPARLSVADLDALRREARSVAEHGGSAFAYVSRLVAAYRALAVDYRRLWGMTLGHDGQPLEPREPDTVEALQARADGLRGFETLEEVRAERDALRAELDSMGEAEVEYGQDCGRTCECISVYDQQDRDQRPWSEPTLQRTVRRGPWEPIQ